MTSNDYLSDFLDQNQLTEKREALSVPDWVDPANSSKKAYEAILSLAEVKKEYIRRHGTHTHFIKRSNYLIMKVEVARIVGVNAQPLFNNVSYAKSLAHFFDHVNNNLEELKSRKLLKNKGGLRQMRKNELVKELQVEKRSNESLHKEVVDAVYQRTLENLSFDVKQKLQLDR